MNSLYPLAVPVLWFPLGDDMYKGVVVNPGSGEVTTIEARLCRANFPYPAGWLIDDGRGKSGKRPRTHVVSVSAQTLERLRSEGQLHDRYGCPTVKDDQVAVIDDVPGPLPRWA